MMKNDDFWFHDLWGTHVGRDKDLHSRLMELSKDDYVWLPSRKGVRAVSVKKNPSLFSGFFFVSAAFILVGWCGFIIELTGTSTNITMFGLLLLFMMSLFSSFFFYQSFPVKSCYVKISLPYLDAKEKQYFSYKLNKLKTKDDDSYHKQLNRTLLFKGKGNTRDLLLLKQSMLMDAIRKEARLFYLKYSDEEALHVMDQYSRMKNSSDETPMVKQGLQREVVYSDTALKEAVRLDSRLKILERLLREKKQFNPVDAHHLDVICEEVLRAASITIQICDSELAVKSDVKKARGEFASLVDSVLPALEELRHGVVRGQTDRISSARFFFEDKHGSQMNPLQLESGVKNDGRLQKNLSVLQSHRKKVSRGG